MATSLPLAGVRVQLSGSVPESATPEEAQAIQQFVGSLACAIFSEGGGVVHGTPHHLDRTAHRGISAVDAALASSAAPTYFDEAHVENEITSQPYLDGGIWANNPILPAISEAVRHLGVPLDRIDVLSVGTIGSELSFVKSLGKGKWGWKDDSIGLFFAAQEHAAVEIASSLLTGARHLRVNQQTPTPIPLDDTEAIEDLVRRGDRVGADMFSVVRSRFLAGFHATDWRT